MKKAVATYTIATLPPCGVCEQKGAQPVALARFDSLLEQYRTWGYTCPTHFQDYGVAATATRLITPAEEAAKGRRAAGNSVDAMPADAVGYGGPWMDFIMELRWKFLQLMGADLRQARHDMAPAQPIRDRYRRTLMGGCYYEPDFEAVDSVMSTDDLVKSWG